MRNNGQRMTDHRHRRDAHGIRIHDELWNAMETCARAERRSRTAWALFFLEAAVADRVLPLPHALAARLKRWAAREGVSVAQLAAHVLAEAARRERRSRRS
jgi:alcohol dehydrogenase class IV